MSGEGRAIVTGPVTATVGKADDGLFRPLAPLFAAMFLGFLTVSIPLPVLPLHVHRPHAPIPLQRLSAQGRVACPILDVREGNA